jgi:hypothetical protein
VSNFDLEYMSFFAYAWACLLQDQFPGVTLIFAAKLEPHVHISEES